MQPIALEDGWKVGDKIYKTVTLREPTALDVIEANAAGEQITVVTVSDKPEVVTASSPTRTGTDLLRRCIRDLDGEEVPIKLDSFKGLSPRDFAKLNAGLDLIDQAASAAGGSVEQRGRDGKPRRKD